ncbi:hypothetical protein L195_g043902 [Trifolium pratense]|uniref:Uncharacterized protein n=1 Tax=Trifolium pratense TaxID=57577 RepID=A0A2K3MAJ5_TRIPR|nr:hypothetical protein L195_g043902 [Trifolium pratense]
MLRVNLVEGIHWRAPKEGRVALNSDGSVVEPVPKQSAEEFCKVVMTIFYLLLLHL